MVDNVAAVPVRPPAPRHHLGAGLGAVLNSADAFLRQDAHADEIGALAVGILMHRRAQLGGHLLTPNDYKRVESIKKLVMDAQAQEAAPRPSVPADRSTELLAAVDGALNPQHQGE
jgi:hypothetical protein